MDVSTHISDIDLHASTSESMDDSSAGWFLKPSEQVGGDHRVESQFDQAGEATISRGVDNENSNENEKLENEYENTEATEKKRTSRGTMLRVDFLFFFPKIFYFLNFRQFP